MRSDFILTDYGGIKLYEIPSFKRSGLVSHGFSTRLGGIGTAPYDTLNLAFHVGDSPETVIANRQIVCRALGADTDSIVAARQVHSGNIALVGPRHAGRGAFSYDTALPDTDGLITDRPGLLLSTFYADCVPIFILDPVKKVIALAHAGWKGTLARIGAETVNKMAAAFGTEPADCLAGIGPSVGPCCYEVDEPLIRLVRDEFDWWPDILEHTKNDRAKLDLWTANSKIMSGAGVKPDNVEIARICTCCNQQLLFSYRGSREVTGRMGAFLMLKTALP